MITWREHNIHTPQSNGDNDYDSDGEKAFVFNLFDDVADKTLTYKFKSKSSAIDITITLTGREQMCTSTGLAVWGGAETLCNYFLEEHDTDNPTEIFRRGRSRVLELGAGLGLCGLFTAKAFEPGEVMLSDGDVDVLERLQKNIEQNATSSRTTVSCAQLVWGQNLDAFEEEHGKFDVIIASECMYMTPSLQTIWQTVNHLLAESNGVFLYVHQASSQVPNEKVLEMATHCGFVWTTSLSYPLVHLFRRKKI
ncbi:hypothetical protein HJC23_003019 [Cyclotella cryptica]|uniref:Calmodulin-lysine N-methyltransferase n=1 Tax=Cyclotella cryptica TaxID=29204 RepID=A0ABD3PSP1_9STRA